MRKLKLFMAACALMGASTAWAQTDVTAQYLQNADFSQGTPITVGVCTYAKDKAGNGTEYAQLVEVEGWEFGVENGDAKAGGLVAFGSGVWIGGPGYTAPVTNSDGDAEGNILGLVAVWQGTAQYVQKATLPAGTYTLVLGVYNSVGGTEPVAKNFIGFIEDGGTEHLAATSVYDVNKWKYEFITFTLDAETAGKFSLGYTSKNVGSGKAQHLFISGIQLFNGEVDAEAYEAAKQAQREIKEAKVKLSNEIAKVKASEDAAALANAIAEAEKALKEGTTKEDFENALAALQKAVEDLANAKELAENTAAVQGAQANNPILTKFVVNGEFNDNVNGWTCTGGFQNQARASNQQGDFTVPFFENWNPDAKVNKMYQTIKNIPNGTYKLKIAAFVNKLADPNESQFVFANKAQEFLTTGDPTFYEVWTVLTTNTMEIGLEQTEAVANWMGIDNVSLTYYGEGDVINAAKNAAHKADWDEAVKDANEALASNDYVNVKGEERAALQAELAKAEPTTAAGYDEATAAIHTAFKAFTAAKASYDAFVKASTVETILLKYASAEKMNAYEATKNVTVKNATEAAAATENITKALRAYYESHSRAEGVQGAVNYDEAVAGANAEVNTGWTPSIGTNYNQPYTSSEGVQSTKYLDGGWAKDAGANIDIKRTVELPAGKYLLTVKARGAVNLDVYTLSIADQTIDLPHANGNVDGTFGNGWEDASIEFESAEGLPLTLELIAKSEASQQWFSANEFRLMQLEKIQIPMADDADYQALAAAIEAAEKNTLGFEKGQFAPYNNVDALVALATAKKIDPKAEEGNTKKVVNNATSTLTAATWTANAEELDAIFNGMFATVTEGANYPLGWTRTNAWGQMLADIEGDYATAYYNQPGSLQYGNQGIYVMPLAANTAYKLSFAYRSHENNSNRGVTVSVLNGEEGLAEAKFAENGSTTEWVVATQFFTTGAAGNYVLTLNNSGNTWMTAVSLVKAVATELTLDEKQTYTAASAYANITLNRTFTADTWNTIVLPFDVDNATLKAQFGENVKIAEVSELSNEKVVFTSMTEPAIKANVPVIIRDAENNAKGFFFQNAITKTGEAKVAGTNADFVGNYEAGRALVTGNYYIAGGKLKIADGNQTINGFRAFFNVTKTEAGNEARMQFVVDGETVTAIDALTTVRNADSRLYNLNGQQVSGNAQKGIFIQNGKKVVLK